MVLIADDEEKNRRLLRDILTAHGYRTSEAVDGVHAIEQVQAVRPDVVLLDVMMPKIDGFSVCSALKEDPATQAIPLLMVTALRDRESRLRGIEAGANDFLNKPVDPPEILLRVRNAMRMKILHDELQRNYVRLHGLERLRDQLTRMIVHDMRTPLMVIDMGIQMLRMEVDDLVDDEAATNLQLVTGKVRELIQMVSSLLDVSRLESGRMPIRSAPRDLVGLVRNAMVQLEPLRIHRRFDLVAPEDLPPVAFDGEIIERVLANLLSNAIRHTGEHGGIIARLKPLGDGVRIEVQDDGDGVPADAHVLIFDKFGQVGHRRSKYSTGLGLTFCKMAVEAHGGEIGVDSIEGMGATFWFTLPLSPEPPPANRDDAESVRNQTEEAST
jgi:signal transduction histidine kinase